MERYIACFDILGYKEFILNNAKDYVIRNNKHIYRESQDAATLGERIQRGGAIYPNLELSKVNCLHFSDTILFWTNDNKPADFDAILMVCHKFYWTCMQTTFAVRGCLGFGDIEYDPFTIPSINGASFYNSSLFGKGLVDTYLNAEEQDWAGCYVDSNAINALPCDSIIRSRIIEKHIYDNRLVWYPIPLKGGKSRYEYAIRILGGPLNNVAFKNAAQTVERVFTQHMNGKPLHESVVKKLHNTIKFLEYFRVEGIK